MICKSQGEGHDGEGGVRKASSGENRASGYKQIFHPVNAAVCINDAHAGIFMHPGRSHEMVRALKGTWNSVVAFLSRDKCSYARCFKIVTEDFLCTTNAGEVEFVPTPIYLGVSLPKSIHLISQRDTIMQMW